MAAHGNTAFALLLVALSLVSSAHAIAFSNSVEVGVCDLNKAATQGNTPACVLTPLQVTMNLAVNQAKYITFTNITNFVKTDFKDYTALVTAITGSTPARIFLMYGACTSMATASTCADFFYNGGTNINNGACSPGCYLSWTYVTGSNPFNQINVPANNNYLNTVNVPFSGSLKNIMASSSWSAGAGGSFVVFVGSLSSVPISTTITWVEVVTSQAVPPAPPRPPSPPPLPPPAAPKGATRNVAGLLAVLLPLLATVFLL